MARVEMQQREDRVQQQDNALIGIHRMRCGLSAIWRKIRWPPTGWICRPRHRLGHQNTALLQAQALDLQAFLAERVEGG